MPILASQQVIDAVVARLVDAATSSGARVYSDRFHPVSVYPTTKVRHVDEDLEADSDDITWPAMRLHRLRIDIDVMVQAAAALDAAMAAAVLEVLQAVEGVATPLSPLNAALRCTGISYQAASDGQAASGQATAHLVAEFTTAANDPSNIF